MNRFSFRIWDNTTKCYMQNLCVINSRGYVYRLFDTGTEFTHRYEKLDNVVIEQCTGVSDKNGKLIYEGDLVKIYPRNIDMTPFVVKVIWNQNECRFVGEYEPEKTVKLYDSAPELYEIISNIHEPKAA